MEKKINLSKVSISKVGTTIFAISLCVASHAQQVVNAAYMNDISGSARTELFEPKKTFKKVINMLDLTDSKDGVNLYTSVIGEPSIVKVNVATLPETEGSSILERNRNISLFLQKGMADFDELAQPTDDQRTEIFRSLISITDHFQPGADRTLLIIESDFVESGYVAEFFDYANTPSALIDDFNKIIAAFKADNGALPDLSGAEVILVVTRGDDELAVFSARWWKRAMLHFGAKEVTVRATL